MTASDIDWVQWVVRAVIITVGVVLAVVIVRGRKEGKHQQYSLRFFVIGATALILGLVLRLVSVFSGPNLGYDTFLIIAGAIIILVGVAILAIWERRDTTQNDSE
ncbi:MAG: hypothetical protein GY854_31120 [Deltaproteobacteria bacterium]|nr:hypothetical protein [Deltaproteobacteria bacterium]